MLRISQPSVQQPEVVAELSANHNGSLDTALELVRAASRAGADAIKLQTYRPETITLNSTAPDFKISASHPLWPGRKLYDLYAEAHTPWEWHEPIFSLANSLGLDFFSTPFDETAVDFLEELGVKRYKIASLEIVDIPLITKVAATGKPIILSTGASSIEEVDLAYQAVVGENPSASITLLLCVSSYPADPSSIGLHNMALLRERYSVPVGFSDHTQGVGVAVAAAALGAEMIEKHMTLDSLQDGPDQAFSSSETEMGSLVQLVRTAALATRKTDFGLVSGEEESRRLRPSLWVTKPVLKGDPVTARNIDSLRPNGGLPPSALPSVLGKTFKHDVKPATPLTRDLLE